MGWDDTTLGFYGLGAAAVTATALRMRRRLQLSRAKHPSLTGHVKLGKRVASLIPFYEYAEQQFFRSDGAPDDVAVRRRDGFMRLSALYKERFARNIRATNAAGEDISDLQFTSAYRVPFQYSRFVREYLPSGAFASSSSGVTIIDLDGNRSYDVAGSYGVNVFGYDFYKDMMAKGLARTADLGPVLGLYHPIVADNVRRLKEISGLEEVSFHMSGTEAVMQAVRLARYHTRRSHLVRFAGAYHGWWGDVQPGIGNPVPARETYTLRDMSEHTLKVLQTRSNIACVLVNPLQALHPNKSAPSDSSLVDSGRSAGFEREAYTAWLQRLRAVCKERGIVLIFDEVFTGFRLARRGAQELFGVQADIVIYGKTVGGGLPVGVVCGRKHLMKRFRDDRPGDICFGGGTFNSHPAVMGAMNAFLQHIEKPDVAALYEEQGSIWDQRAQALNERLRIEGLPVQIANLTSIWTVCYTQPSRYNWMLQYYLRAEGLHLSWVGTGRLIFSLNYNDVEFGVVAARFIAAAKAMQRDGWWWSDPMLTNKAIKRRILKEMIAHRVSALRDHQA